MIKKFSGYENIHSVNPLYLIIHSVTGHFKEKYEEKYLIIDSIEEYEKVFSEIKSEIKTLNGRKEGLFLIKKVSRDEGFKFYYVPCPGLLHLIVVLN